VVAAGASFFAPAANAAGILAITGPANVATLNLGSSITGTHTVSLGLTNGSTAVTFTGTDLTATDSGMYVTAASGIAPNTTVGTINAGAHTAVLSKAFTGSTGAVNVTVVGQLSTAQGLATYGVRVTSAVAASNEVHVKLLSSPSSSAKLFVDALGVAAAPAGTDAWAPLSTVSSGATDFGPLAAQNGRVYVAPDTAGTYSFQFYEDADSSGGPSSGDNLSPVVTLNAVDVSTWNPTVSAPSSLATTVAVPSTVDLSGLTVGDARSSTSILAALRTLTKFKFEDLTTPATIQTQVPDALVSGNLPALTSTLAASDTTARAGHKIRTTVILDANNDGSWDATTEGRASMPQTSIVADAFTGAGNTLVQTNVDGTVKTSGTANHVLVKAATTSVVYTASATGANGNKIFFTVTPKPNTTSGAASTLPTISADGLLLSTQADGSRLYAAATDGSGNASLTVHTTDTSDLAHYTVAAASNETTATPLTADFAASAATTIESTNTTAELTPQIGSATTVTLKAAVMDQWGNKMAPASDKAQQATLNLGGAKTVPVTSGSFTYTYAPTTVPSSPTSTQFTWNYVDATTATSSPYYINWASNVKATAVTLSTPVDAASDVKVAVGTGAPSSAQSNPGFGDVNGEVRGTVAGADGSGVAYKKVTLSGDDGVYFSNSATATSAYPLVKTVDAVTDGNGQFGGVYAYFTKSGTQTVRVKADDAKASSTVTVLAPTTSDGYIVSDDDAQGTPATAIAVRGKLVDAFGNAVVGKQIDWAVTPAGHSATDSGNVQTGSDGSFSASWTPLAGTSTTVVFTATINGQGSNKTLNSSWISAGLKDLTAVGQYKDTSNILVGPVTLIAPASRRGAGTVKLAGSASPGAVVEIYGRTVGSAQGLVLLDTVTADAHGSFAVDEYVTDTTTFTAKSGGTYSASAVVVVSREDSNGGGGTVVPTPIIKAFGAKAAGNGIVNLTVIGNGDYRSKVTVSILSGKTYKVVRTYNVDNKGVARATIKTSKGTKTFKITYKNDTKTVTKIYKVKVK
jgi:hypothetical protein